LQKKLVNLYDDAIESGLFKKYPFYTPVTIPANTYRGQYEEVRTYMDSALWIANKNVPDDVVYNMVKSIFTREGLRYLITIKKTAKQMSIEKGLLGAQAIKLHPGAARFWKEMGVIK
jgi:TRAP transporter TAXI family solute receptor